MPMTSFRNYQSLSLAPLLSILYSQPHHSYFTRYVSAKRCKKAPAISAADQFSRSFFAKVLVLSLIQSFYVSFRDINTTVSTWHELYEWMSDKCWIISRLRKLVISRFTETGLKKNQAKITVFLHLSVCGNMSKASYFLIIKHTADFSHRFESKVCGKMSGFPSSQPGSSLAYCTTHITDLLRLYL